MIRERVEYSSYSQHILVPSFIQDVQKVPDPQNANFLHQYNFLLFSSKLFFSIFTFIEKLVFRFFTGSKKLVFGIFIGSKKLVFRIFTGSKQLDFRF